MAETRAFPGGRATRGPAGTGRDRFRLAEATALADIFGISLSGLLGRPDVSADERSFSLRALNDAATGVARQAEQAVITLLEAHERTLTFDFKGRDAAEKHVGDIFQGLTMARDAALRLSSLTALQEGPKR